MGSYGLPALAIKPPEQPDLLGQAGKVMQLKNMMQQGQLQGQALQSGQLDLQAKQRVAQDQQTVMQAFQQAPQGATISDILPSLQGKITPQTYASLQKADLDRRKEVAELDDKNIVVAKGVHDQLQQIYNNAMNMPDDQLAAQTPQLAQQINSIPGNKFKINPTQPITKQELQSFGPVLGLNEAYLAQEAQKRQTQATLTKANLENTKTQQEIGYGPQGPIAEAKYRSIIERVNANQPVPDADRNWAKAYEASNTKTTTSSDSLGIKSINTSGPSGLSAIRGGSVGRAAGASGVGAPGATPGNSLIDEIGTGKMGMQRLEMLLSRRPEILQAVAQKYPDFDSSKIKSYADAYRSFTSGADAKQVNAGAVAVQHLADLKRINDENPTESRIPGTAAYKAFHNLLDTVADELVTFYGEPKTNEAMDSKKSTLGGLTNRNAAISEQARAMGIKMDEMEQKWQNAAPSSAYQAPMPGMSAKAKQARAALDPEYAAKIQGEQSQPSKSSPQAQQGGSGMGVSLAAAKQLPQNKGKSDAQIKADIQAHGHAVLP